MLSVAHHHNLYCNIPNFSKAAHCNSCLQNSGGMLSFLLKFMRAFMVNAHSCTHVECHSIVRISTSCIAAEISYVLCFTLGSSPLNPGAIETVFAAQR